MPTYDYVCRNCDHEFELFQAMSAAVKKKCPECRKLKLERLIGTGAAVLFKGSGFYETDYRSDSYKKSAESEKKAGEKKKKKDDSSSSDKSTSSESKKTETSKSSDATGKKSDGKKTRKSD